MFSATVSGVLCDSSLVFFCHSKKNPMRAPCVNGVSIKQHHVICRSDCPCQTETGNLIKRNQESMLGTMVPLDRRFSWAELTKQERTAVTLHHTGHGTVESSQENPFLKDTGACRWWKATPVLLTSAAFLFGRGAYFSITVPSWGHTAVPRFQSRSHGYCAGSCLSPYFTQRSSDRKLPRRFLGWRGR